MGSICRPYLLCILFRMGCNVMGKKYIPLAVRRAQAYEVDAAQLRQNIAKIREVERLRAKLLDYTPTVEVSVAPNYDGGGKPVKYSQWKRFVDSLTVGYVPESVDGNGSVQVYCVHCGLPTDASTAKRIAIGVITEYDDIETVIVNAGVNSYWEEEEVTRIRPAMHKGDGCLPCYHAYNKAVTDAKRLTTRIRYSVDGVKKTLYAANIKQGSSLLAEQMGRVELLECKQVPPRQGFLNVRVKVAEFIPNPKSIARDAERRALALAKQNDTQARTNAILARVLADNLASKQNNRRRSLKARLAVFAAGKPVRNWLRVAASIQNWEIA